jgi:rubredoxin
MAQELIVSTWCDACLAEGERTEGEPVSVALGRSVALILDLCERHRKELVDPLAETLAEHGRRPDGKPVKRARAAAPVEGTGSERPSCPVCGASPSTFGAMSGHLRRMHGTTVTEAYGTVCPVCGSDHGHGTHIARMHQIEGGMVGAFEWARANGDPAGVVAAQLAALGA